MFLSISWPAEGGTGGVDLSDGRLRGSVIGIEAENLGELVEGFEAFLDYLVGLGLAFFVVQLIEKWWVVQRMEHACGDVHLFPGGKCEAFSAFGAAQQLRRLGGASG